MKRFLLMLLVALTFSWLYSAELLEGREWHFNKTGKDTRGIVMGLSTPPMKIAMAVGGTIGLWLLGWTGYVAGFTPTAEWIDKYMMCAYMIPAGIGFIAACIFAFGYRLSDEEAAHAAAENFKKLQADRAAMAAQKQE